MKEALKNLADKLASALTFIPAAWAGHGKRPRLFAAAAQRYAGLPGFWGEYLRRAFYRRTLRSCSKNCCISYGTFFSDSDATVEDGVYIGAYCIIGRARIGARTQIGSNVHVINGRHMHLRDEDGNILGSESGEREVITIGANCWIGSSAVIMADVGEGTTIGAGAVVTKPIPAGVVAVGVPARVIKQTT